MYLSWPLIGRSEQLQRIDAALAAPDVSGVVVSGAAGVGKTRVAREALSAAQAQGWTTHLAVGTSSARGIPLGAFAAWAPPGVTEPVQLLRGVIESLTAAPCASNVVIVVDDAHLLDDLSAFVVHQIIARRAAKVILTVLEGEPIPAQVQEIWKAGQLDRLCLEPLQHSDTTRLLTQTLGGPVDPEAAQRLWTLTLGNVLYLSNIVEQEIADGRIEQQAGWWRWVGDPVIPPGLVELIESRIGSLPAPVGQVVDVLAVGEPLELTTLRQIADPDAVEEAEIRGLISLHATTTGIDVRISHPIYGEVRRRRAPATTLRRLRGVVATELAASNGRDEIHVLVRRASLSLDSDLRPDADLLTRAALGAVWLADLGLAARLAQAALRSAATPEPYFIRAHALSWLGHGREADATLAAIDTACLSDADSARLAFLRASNMLWALGDPVAAKRLIDEAASTTQPENRSYIDAFLTVYWFAMDRPDAAVLAAQDLEFDQMPPVVGAELAWVLTTIDADAGRAATAVRNAEAGYLVATRSFDAPQMRFNIADSHVSALWLAGHIDEAREIAERVRRQAATLPGAAQLLGPAVAGRAALAGSDLPTACMTFDEAVRGLSANHSLGWGFRYLIPQTMALAIGGRIEEAAAGLAALDAIARRFRLLDYERSIARAWVVAGQGVLSEAIDMALSAADRARESGRFGAEVLCLQTAAQLGDGTRAARLRELESVVEGPRVGLASRFAVAVRDGDAEGLELLSKDFERMGDVVAAVDTACHAALAYRRHDKRGSALRCTTRAQSLAEPRGIHTPALLTAIEPLPLTEREREVAMLVGQGMSSREIAERLSLSVRTVESHTYRAMSKTGTSTREELAALLPRHTESAPRHGLDASAEPTSAGRENRRRRSQNVTNMLDQR